ncbi:unnamed protein product [Calypogeia fissa]
MVITTPHVVRQFLFKKEDVEKPYQKLINSTKSTITVQLTFKGCSSFQGPKVQATDIQCYLKRITIGRVSACDLCIPDDNCISRYHSAIECNSDGVWSFRDIGSKSGSSLKPDPTDPEFPKFGSVQPRVLDKNTPYLLQNGDVISIGRVHYGIAHEIKITVHRPEDDLKDDEDDLLLSGGGVATHKLTWRRSLHCNGCMGWGRRHSCSARLSQLQKMILECNRKSNLTAPQAPKTAIQKVLFHRLSGWWEKKPEKSVTFKVSKRHESDPVQVVGALPDDLVSEHKITEELSINNEDEHGEFDDTMIDMPPNDGEQQPDTTDED